MLKTFKRLNHILCVLVIFAIIGCSSPLEQHNGEAQWDFDHQLQFSLTKLAGNEYHLEVIPNDRSKFNKIAVFVMRRALVLCKQYGFNIEMLKDIEKVVLRRKSPSIYL